MQNIQQFFSFYYLYSCTPIQTQMINHSDSSPQLQFPLVCFEIDLRNMVLGSGQQFYPILNIAGMEYQYPNNPPSSMQSLSQHLQQLNQKYRNYLVQKEISISLEESQQKEPDRPQYEEKKESKKLNELLKQNPKGEQENFFLEVPSIDSIEMAPSHSNRNKTENSSEHPPQKAKINIIHKLKASRAKIDLEQSRMPTIQPLPIAQSPKQERGDSLKAKAKDKNESRGKSKKGKSKGRPVETKKMDSRKIITSEQFKPPKNYQFSSVKNIEPIKMNKVKGASKMAASASTGLHLVRSLQMIRVEKGSQDPSKSKSKGKTTSFKSKKSNSNSSSKTSLKKQGKTVSPSKDKIYTSVKQTLKRR